MNIIGIGEIVIDRLYYIDDFPIDGQKAQSSESFLALGGPAPAALKFLKNMGCDTKLFGSVGKDTASIYVEEMYDKDKIETYFKYDTTTRVNTVLVNSATGSRTIIKDRNQNKPLDGIPLEYLHKADLVVFDRSEPEAFDFVLKNKKEHTKIVVDPSTEWSPKIIHMMKHSDACVFPIETVEQMSDRDNLRHNLDLLYKEIGKTLVITDGGNGTYLFDGKERKVIPALDIKPIDTNGAGDVFRGAFAWGLLQGWELEKNIEFCNKIAGLQCLKKGNLTAIPSRDEVEGY